MAKLEKKSSTIKAMKELIEKEAGQNTVYQVAILSIASAIFETAVLIVLNNAAQLAGDTSRRFFLLYIFIIIFIIWFVIIRLSRYSMCAIIHKIINRIRLRVVEKIYAADLRSFERLGYAELLVQFSDDTEMIADAAGELAIVIGKTVVVLCCLAYIAYISVIAAIIVLSGLILGGLAYMPTMNTLWNLIAQSRELQKDIFTDIRHFLFGFKELKLNDKKSDSFFHQGFKVRSNKGMNVKIKTGVYFTISYVIAMVVWYLMLMMIVFLLPAMTHIQPEKIMVIIVVILFMPLDIFMAAIPYINRASVSLERLKLMERSLDVLTDSFSEPSEALVGFDEIRLENVTFEYFDNPADNLFSLGPINCTIRKGELIFITGGNGYGKSTLLKLICGLYKPKSGHFYIDGKTVSMENHRELFSAVFSDYHLFDRLYGLKDINPDRVNELLKKMKIDHKTQYRDGRFTIYNLSSGQRKRLALISCLLEDRPVYAFDEWAAEQDPSFRSYFYRELLHELKVAGKTIIVITHDDRYFDVADKLLPLEFGQMAA